MKSLRDGFKKLLDESGALELRGEGSSDAADAVRDAMDGIWRELSPGERDLFTAESVRWNRDHPELK